MRFSEATLDGFMDFRRSELLSNAPMREDGT